MTTSERESVKEFSWILQDIEQANINEFMHKLDISEILARLLVGRDVALN